MIDDLYNLRLEEFSKLKRKSAEPP